MLITAVLPFFIMCVVLRKLGLPSPYSPGSWLLCWFPGVSAGGRRAERLLRFTGLRDQRLITEMGCQARRAEVLKVLKAL